MRSSISKKQVVYSWERSCSWSRARRRRLMSQAEACGCRCPLIYAPVTCDHGKTYPNPCVADCHNAKNCVPSGLLATENSYTINLRVAPQNDRRRGRLSATVPH